MSCHASSAELYFAFKENKTTTAVFRFCLEALVQDLPALAWKSSRLRANLPVLPQSDMEYEAGSEMCFLCGQ